MRYPQIVLGSNAEQKIRNRSPWIMDKEIHKTAKGLISGSLVEAINEKGHFLALGYYNEKSRISFRALSYQHEVIDAKWVIEKLLIAWKKRYLMGYQGSFRMVFSEADFLPGLVIDYYHDGLVQIFVVQVSTAGMARLFHDPYSYLRELVDRAQTELKIKYNWDHSIIVVRNDMNVRKFEGLEIEPTRLLKVPRDIDLSKFSFYVGKKAEQKLLADLLNGQKTGFFLDQTHNIEWICNLINDSALVKNISRPVRILDLCCYVGQWSSRLSHFLKQNKIESECHLVDVSQSALDIAEHNLRSVGAINIKKSKSDVLKDLSDWPINSEDDLYDIVICDPPALAKSQKDLPTGKHAYMKLNQQAFRLAAKNSLVVSCSCSGALDEKIFSEVLLKACLRAGKEPSYVFKTGNPPDHPNLHGFYEGSYLKMFVHIFAQ